METSCEDYMCRDYEFLNFLIFGLEFRTGYDHSGIISKFKHSDKVDYWVEEWLVLKGRVYEGACGQMRLKSRTRFYYAGFYIAC